MSDTNETIEPQFGGSTVESQATEAPQGEEVAPEQQEAAKPEPSPEEQRFAAKFAALSRKEKQIRQQEAKMQQQMQELQAKLEALEKQSKEVETYKSIPDRLKREPLKVFEEQGIKFEQLAEMILNDGKPTQDMILSEYEKKMMSKLEEMEKKLAEKETKEAQEREQAAITNFKAQLTDFVNNSPEYELIKANDSVDLVYEVIEQHYNETGEILSNKDACEAVEEYWLEEAKKLVDREKVKKLLMPQEPKKPAQSGRQSSPTLSNAAAAQASTKPSRKLSDEESKLEAAKLLKWIE